MSREFDFDADELLMLRQLFRAEADDAFDLITRQCHAAGSDRPSVEAFAEMLRVTHAIKGAAGTVALPQVVDAVHQLEIALLMFRDGAATWSKHVRDAVIDSCDELRTIIEREARATENAPITLRRLQSLLGLDATPALVTELDSEVQSAPTQAIADPGVRPPLRVTPERLDAVMATAGELLFDRTRIERRAQLLRTLSRDIASSRQTLRATIDELVARHLPDHGLGAVEQGLAAQAALLAQTSAALIDETEALRRSLSELQRRLTAVRMDSAQSLFSYAARAMRALRRATGAAVELITRGETTEFDRTVAEALHDPIVQILRNTVGHGIDAPAERLTAGKPAHVTITLTAQQEAGYLVLTIADDGRGVDIAALRTRLVETGRWPAARAQIATDEEIVQALLITPVSGKAESSALAGHGIGLDSVRQSIARLGGELALTSVPGRGTTLRIRVPLSTAVGSAMLFKVAGQVYALPAVFVAQETTVRAGDTTALVRGESVPVLALESVLGHHAASGVRTGLVVNYAGRMVICTVDKIVGVREIVIKPKDPLLASLALYAGATISGSGKVQLILDPAQLVRRAYAPLGQLAAHLENHALPSLPAGRALVVDDSRAIREAMTSMLAREGWIVDVAEDGARALQALAQHPYDLLVTDIEMPGMDGWQLLAELPQHHKGPAPMVIVITSRVHADNRQRAAALGARALVAKPITRRKLLEALAAPGLGTDDAPMT